MSDHSELIERLQKARLFIADRMVEIPETLRDQAAAAIRDLIAERDAARQSNDTALAIAMQAGADAERDRAWNEAIEACEAERLGEPQDEADAAYDRGVEHCAAAIRAMRKDTPQ